jgi:hypothetical protein
LYNLVVCKAAQFSPLVPLNPTRTFSPSTTKMALTVASLLLGTGQGHGHGSGGVDMVIP